MGGRYNDGTEAAEKWSKSSGSVFSQSSHKVAVVFGSCRPPVFPGVRGAGGAGVFLVGQELNA